MSRISEIMLERRCSYTEAKRVAEQEAQGSFAAPAGSARSSFEQWISGPPYERETERWPQDETKHAWPGQYKDIAVQLAWESWEQAQNVPIRTHQMACAARLECEELREALRKAVAWGESASRHILYRENINWRYLDEARAVLDKANDECTNPEGCE